MSLDDLDIFDLERNGQDAPAPTGRGGAVLGILGVSAGYGAVLGLAGGAAVGLWFALFGLLTPALGIMSLLGASNVGSLFG